jgi:hypothetical protein
VKPAADRIASVRKQIEIYEGMERIPGGPKNFMETSIATLEETQNNLHSWERQVSVKLHLFEMLIYNHLILQPRIGLYCNNSIDWQLQRFRRDGQNCYL